MAMIADGAGLPEKRREADERAVADLVRRLSGRGREA
jgi:hypothetical protein